MHLNFRKPFQFFLFFMLGLSSWFVVSVIFSEIPLLVQLLYEAEAVGSTLDLCINLSNVVPLFLVLFQRKTGKSGDAHIIFMSCLTNVAVSFAFIFMFPSSSTSARASSHSLIIVSSLAGIVGNTSMVTLFPYVRPYGAAAISALSAGVGACGLVAQLLSTAQSVGRTRVAPDGSSLPDPAFSLQVLFAVVCGCSLLSLSCFVVIHKRVMVLTGDGWVRRSVGAEQPAAGVAHLLQPEDDPVGSFSAVLEANEEPNCHPDDSHADSAQTTGMLSVRNETRGKDCRDDSRSGNDGSRSINPSVLIQSLTAAERWVCMTLACSCFVMYVLPGTCRDTRHACSSSRVAHRPHTFHVRCCRQQIHHNAMAILCILSRLSSRPRRCLAAPLSWYRRPHCLQRSSLACAHDARFSLAKRVDESCSGGCHAVCHCLHSDQWCCLHHGVLHGFE
jgi:hypothetical protein